MLKCYILIDSSYAIENPSGVSYFVEIITKSIPDLSWNTCYTEDIPIDGNVYIILTSAVSSFFNKMVSEKIILKKDIICNSPILEKDLYFCPFNFEPDSIKNIKEIKKLAWNLIKDVIKPSILILSESFLKRTIENKKDEDKDPIESNIIPDVIIPESIVSTGVEKEDLFSYSYEEFVIDINDFFKTLVDSKIKIKESPLDVYEGIKIYSSKTPEKFITLSNSSKKYENKMSLNELFVILKASLVTGADSITYRMVKKNIAS